MPRILRTPEAKIDAAEIWCYIAEDNEAAADNLGSRTNMIGWQHVSFNKGKASGRWKA